MKSLRRRLPGLLALLLGLPAMAQTPPAKPAPDARYGNVLYKAPDPARWSVEDRGDRRVYSAKVPRPQFATITLFLGGPLRGDFATAFQTETLAALKETGATRIEGDGGVQESRAAEGFPVRQQTLVGAAPGVQTYHWFLAGNSGGRFDLLAFQASSQELFQRYGQDAGNLYYSVKLANSLAPAAADLAARPAPAAAARQTVAARAGPLAVGDRVAIPWGGGWVPGTVLHVEGLTYFVHYAAPEKDDGRYDDFFTLELIRPPGGSRTYAETWRGTVPDPEGGPLALGTEVEFYDGRWKPARIARRLGERYVVFQDKPGDVTELWLTPDKIRLPGATAPLAPERPFVPRRPANASEVRIGDLVEAKPKRGFWTPLTVIAQRDQNYFVKIGPNSGLSMRGWVDLSKMRAVGAKDPFQAEDLSFFVGRWRLSGDSFQTMVDRKVSGGKVSETYQNNSGAGQGAGQLTINADGTYILAATAVYHDGRGRWERNPNQEEGGIVLRGADDNGAKDCLVTNHLDGYAYFQGAIRGPGKWCTRVP